MEAPTVEDRHGFDRGGLGCMRDIAGTGEAVFLDMGQLVVEAFEGRTITQQLIVPI